MASLSPAEKLALGRYWSEIYGGAAQRLSTSDMYADIRQRASDLGLPSVGVGVAAISRLRSYATGMVNAAAAFAAAAPTDPLTSTHIAATPWGRPQSQQNILPVLNVGFQHTIQQQDGSVVTRWQTIALTGALPDTVGALQDAITAEAVLLAQESPGTSPGSPKGTSLGVTDLTLTAV